jgi:hypothetical protein
VRVVGECVWWEWIRKKEGGRSAGKKNMSGGVRVRRGGEGGGAEGKGARGGEGGARRGGGRRGGVWGVGGWDGAESTNERLDEGRNSLRSGQIGCVLCVQHK